MTTEEWATFRDASYQAVGERQPELLDQLRRLVVEGRSGAEVTDYGRQIISNSAGPAGDDLDLLAMIVEAAVGYMLERRAAGQPF